MRKSYLLAVLLLGPAGLGADPQAPVPPEQEPHHHVLLKNDFVEVVRATLAPGESTLYHIHTHDSAGVDLADSTTTEQLMGGKEGPPSTSKAGEAWAQERNPKPYIHRVHNVGSGAMDLIDVELLQQPKHPSAHAAAKIEAENPQARVYEWNLAPGAVSAMHTHERPYVIIAATPMQLKMAAPDGRSLRETVKAGDFHWIEASVTHSLANEGQTAGEIVEIELK